MIHMSDIGLVFYGAYVDWAWWQLSAKRRSQSLRHPPMSPSQRHHREAKLWQSALNVMPNLGVSRALAFRMQRLWTKTGLTLRSQADDRQERKVMQCFGTDLW